MLQWRVDLPRISDGKIANGSAPPLLPLQFIQFGPLRSLTSEAKTPANFWVKTLGDLHGPAIPYKIPRFSRILESNPWSWHRTYIIFLHCSTSSTFLRLGDFHWGEVSPSLHSEEVHVCVFVLLFFGVGVFETGATFFLGAMMNYQPQLDALSNMEKHPSKWTRHFSLKFDPPQNGYPKLVSQNHLYTLKASFPKKYGKKKHKNEAKKVGSHGDLMATWASAALSYFSFERIAACTWAGGDEGF